MSTYETTQNLAAPIPSPSYEQISRIKLFAVCLLIPCAFISSVLYLAPNFSADHDTTTHELRENSYGGDLLQEYVGGHIWNTEITRLYDWKYSAGVQHDPAVVGFQWEPSSYYPMVYPPFHYQLASLSSGMAYRNFIVLWMFGNGVALSLAAFMFLSGYRNFRIGAGAWFFVALLFTPLLMSLSMGQKSAMLLAILTVTFLLLHRQRPLAAGLVFGLIAFKPYLAIPIGLMMLFKKQYRFVAGSLATLSVLIVASLIAAPGSWGGYLQVCLGMTDYSSNAGYQLELSHSIWGSFELLLSRFPDLVKPMGIIAAIGVLTIIGRIMSGPIETSSNRFAFQFSALIIATVLLSPHFYSYDLTILLLPLAICGLSAEISHRINRRVLYWICIAVLFGASIYGPIALSLGVQVSTLILFAWLIVIAGGWNAIDVMGQGTLKKAAN